MSGDGKEKELVFIQEGYTGGVYSPEGYRPELKSRGNKSTAGHQPKVDVAPAVVVIKAEPKNPPKGR